MEKEIQRTKMIISRFSVYRDGGTMMFVTTKGTYYIDNRIFTNTKGEIFLEYPHDNGYYLTSEDKANFLEELGEAIKTESYGEPLHSDNTSKDCLAIIRIVDL